MMRAVACRKLHKKDLKAKYKRALRRPPKATNIKTYLPGTRVYFWTPQIGKGRLRRDAGACRGPAMILQKDKGNYFVSWRGQVLLVSERQIRIASVEEAAAAGHIAKDLNLTADNVDEQDEKMYEDARANPPSDEPAPPAAGSAPMEEDPPPAADIPRLGEAEAPAAAIEDPTEPAAAHENEEDFFNEVRAAELRYQEEEHARQQAECLSSPVECTIGRSRSWIAIRQATAGGSGETQPGKTPVRRGRKKKNKKEDDDDEPNK